MALLTRELVLNTSLSPREIAGRIETRLLERPATSKPPKSKFLGEASERSFVLTLLHAYPFSLGYATVGVARGKLDPREETTQIRVSVSPPLRTYVMLAAVVVLGLVQVALHAPPKDLAWPLVVFVLTVFIARVSNDKVALYAQVNLARVLRP